MQPGHVTRLSRRGCLVSAAALLTARAQAADVPTLAFGRSGWLYPAWEDVRHVSLARSRKAGDVIAQAAAILRQADIETCMLLTPMKARIYPEFLPADFQPNADVARRYAALMEDWRRDGLIVPDLAALFAEKRRTQPEPLYFKADLHWTTTAADLAAIETARLIRERHTLPPSPRPGTRLGPYATMAYAQNDLARQLPDSEFKKYPFETTRFRAPLGGRLTDPLDQPADIAVIGNAFVHPGYTYPTVLSNQLDRPVLAQAKTGRSPYAMLLDYLASPAFHTLRARVVVWHFMEGVMDLPPDFTAFWQTGTMTTTQFHDQLRHLVTG